ncbi:hypothetical protein [Janthinobacterium sp. LB3P112]|uniref:hypothetical protein n=1 Tax=Janthinobacterium sp. LB3P112 TaxID=3424196 RepID=UPI003F212B75
MVIFVIAATQGGAQNRSGLEDRPSRHDLLKACHAADFPRFPVADPVSGRVLRFSSSQESGHLSSDARCFSLLAQGVEVQPGQVTRFKLAYRFGVQDIDAFDISEPVSMMSNK